MSRRVGPAVALALLLSGCAAPKQYGGPIPIDHRGVSTRLHLLCRYGVEEGRCVSAEPPSPPARPIAAQQLVRECPPGEDGGEPGCKRAELAPPVGRGDRRPSAR